MLSRKFLPSSFLATVWTLLMVGSSPPLRGAGPFFRQLNTLDFLIRSWNLPPGSFSPLVLILPSKAAQMLIWREFHDLEPTVHRKPTWEKKHSMLAWLGTQTLQSCRPKFQFWPHNLHQLLTKLCDHGQVAWPLWVLGLFVCNVVIAVLSSYTAPGTW